MIALITIFLFFFFLSVFNFRHWTFFHRVLKCAIPKKGDKLSPVQFDKATCYQLLWVSRSFRTNHLTQAILTVGLFSNFANCIDIKCSIAKITKNYCLRSKYNKWFVRILEKEIIISVWFVYMYVELFVQLNYNCIDRFFSYWLNFDDPDSIFFKFISMSFEIQTMDLRQFRIVPRHYSTSKVR